MGIAHQSLPCEERWHGASRVVEVLKLPLCRGVKKMCRWHIFSHRPQQLRCEEGSCLERNCLRRPYSFCASKKNMESRGVKKMCRRHIFSQDRSGYAARREVIKTALSPSLETPRGASKGKLLCHIIISKTLEYSPRMPLRTLLRRGACSAPQRCHLVRFANHPCMIRCTGYTKKEEAGLPQGKLE